MKKINQLLALIIEILESLSKMMKNYDEAIQNLNEALIIYNKFEQKSSRRYAFSYWQLLSYET